MAETGAFISDSEIPSLFRWAESCGVTFVSNGGHSGPEVAPWSADACLAQLSSANSANVWLTRPDWSLEPLGLHPISTEGDRFAVTPRYGGPALQLLIYRSCTLDQGKKVLGYCSLTSWPFTYSLDRQRKLYAVPAMKAFMASFGKRLRQRAFRLRLGRFGHWVTRAAIDEIRDGHATVRSPWNEALPQLLVH